MPTRSIALRLDLSNSEQRIALWTTHRLVNEKARWFVEQLLILRGDEVWTADAALAHALGHTGQGANTHGLFEVKAEMVQTRLREQIRVLKPEVSPNDLEVAVKDLGSLYNLVVPSHVEDREGDAQQANQFMGNLLDPGSVGGASALRKAIAPDWVQRKMNEDPDWEASAESWRVGALAIPRPTGRQPAWRGLAEKNDSKWIEAFLKDLDKNQKKAGVGGESALVTTLKQAGLLPIWRRYRTIKETIHDEGRGYLSRWDRLSFKLAVARLLSWESWNHRAHKEHDKRAAEFASVEAAMATYAKHKAMLKAYEQERTKELQSFQNGLADEKTDFRLGGRQIRKWEALARELRHAPEGADLAQIVADFQMNNPKESPDPYFTDWVLSAPSRNMLWATDGGVKAVQLLAKANRLERKKNKSRERTAMTPPHARLHPIWLQFEEPSGGNLKHLDLEQLPEGGWVAVFDLISPEKGGGQEECKFRIPIRPSPQLALQKLEKLGKKTGEPGKTPVLTFIQAPSFSRVADRSNFETWTGTMQSPDILLDRTILEANPDQTFDPLNLRADLKLVLDLKVKPVEGAGDISPLSKKDKTELIPQWARLLNCSLAPEAEDAEKKNLPRYLEYFDTLAEGQRFLSVDLGVRDLAAVALFEIRRGAVTAGEEAFPIPATSPWKAVLVPGSIDTLSLPGELATQGDTTEGRRREAKDALYLLKFLKSRRTLLLRLSHTATEAKSRAKALDALQRKPKDPQAQARLLEDRNRHTRSLSALLDDDAPPRAKGDRASGKKQETKASNVDKRFHPALRQATGLDPLPDDLTKIPVAQTILDAWDAAIAELVRVWRNRTRRRDPQKSDLHGKSLWAIEHLSEVRDFLKGWHRRGTMTGDINPPTHDFAKALLDHINQLKEDRIKEGANLLVNTARGLRYDPDTHRWEAKFPPAHLILFEDLARYRFFTDRTRSENSQLMRWAHRELTKNTGQMAQLFGIGMMDTGAAFSSKYHGWSGAPGVRCRTFTQDELSSDWFKRRWKAANYNWQPVAGLPVPWDGGKHFHTLDAKGHLLTLDADHNAALSIARRFAMRNGETIRLVGTGTENGTFVPDSLGKRLLGGLRDETNPKDKGYGHLVPIPGGHAYTWESTSQSEWEKASEKKVSKKGQEDAEPEDDADAINAAQEAAETESGRVDDAKAGKKITFFRDPSGIFFPSHQWIPGEIFWGMVEQRISSALGKEHEANRPF